MHLLHDPADPGDPILTSPLLWLCFPLAIGIETVRSVRSRRAARTSASRAGTSTTTQTS
jgi:hypothetical protein